MPDTIVDPTSLPFSEPGYRGVLPHLHKRGCTYFVTFCLADVAGRRAAQRRRLLESKGRRDIPDKMDPEPTIGCCILKNPKLAVIVEDSLLHFQGERYVLSAWCVMPNHVHAVVTPLGEEDLPEILKSWKGYSARQINR